MASTYHAQTGYAISMHMTPSMVAQRVVDECTGGQMTYQEARTRLARMADAARRGVTWSGLVATTDAAVGAIVAAAHEAVGRLHEPRL